MQSRKKERGQNNKQKEIISYPQTPLSQKERRFYLDNRGTEDRNACKTFSQLFFIKVKQQTTQVQGDTWVCAVRLRVHEGVGRGQRALKAVQGLPNCAPRPVTEHRIQHFVYFSQLSAHKKGLDATRPSGHRLAALKQADKIRPRQTFLSPPALLQRRLAKNKAQRSPAQPSAALLQLASAEVTRLIRAASRFLSGWRLI